MKRVWLSLAIAGVVFATSTFAQDASYRAPAARTYAAAPGGVLAPPAATQIATVAQFLNARGIAVTATSLADVATTAAMSNISVVRLEERVGGLAVYGVYAKASFNARGELVHLIENLVPASGAVAPGRVTGGQALAIALQRQYGNAVAVPPQIRAQGNTVVFAQTPFFHEEPTATRVAMVAADGSLQAATLVETWSEQQNLLHHTLVGGNGDIVGVELRTNSDRYNVFAVDPGKSTQGVVTGPAPVSPVGTAPSPAGWLSSTSQTTVNITGNNAHSYLDADANNRPDKGGTSVTNGDFLTAWDGSLAPTTTANKAVAVQNLFYLNNVVHDTLYGYGFVESAGNFQTNNFGRGGAGNDPVQAEAQDGSGTDNANFSTPSDGRAPRMQMYLWSNPAPDHEVLVNGASYGAKKADFGTSLTTTGISGALVLVNDGVGTTSDGCEPMSGLTGKIALVDRGTCSFKTKVVYAQNAGAVGVVVANNQGGDAIFAMADDPSILNRVKIPAVMISQNSGATVKTVLSGGSASSTLRKLAVTPPMIDASLDSDVVFHEYGHGLTWRMIGSMSGPLAGAIGEGASDGVAVLINGNDVVGEYSAGTASGIRRYPYTNYPLTYGSVTGAEVHDDGEVFAAIVWRMRELASTTTGASASQVFAHYVNGMNYTPARPAWEDMRDGMLQSAAGNAPMTCVIWKAFSDFGVGVGANGVENLDGTVTITESFTMPAGVCQ